MRRVGGDDREDCGTDRGGVKKIGNPMIGFGVYRIIVRMVIRRIMGNKFCRFVILMVAKMI